MKSVVTHKTYGDIELLHISATTLRVQSDKGAWYCELTDSTWIGRDDEYEGAVRYATKQSHGGLLSLTPVYELVEGRWVNIRTGEEVPAASPKTLSAS